MAGTRQRTENDDQLLEQMSAVLDALYAHLCALHVEWQNQTTARS